MAQALRSGNIDSIEERREGGEPFADEQVEKLSALGQAISDPIRVRMLGMMAAGRECCPMPESGVPEDMSAGLCVCEFESYFDMGQSKVSYHVKKLKDAGLVREERHGRWNYYSIDQEAVRGLLGDAAESLLAPEAKLAFSPDPAQGVREGAAGDCC